MSKKLFSNVGARLEKISVILFWIVAVLMIAAGVLLIINGIQEKELQMTVTGVLTLLLSGILTWISCLSSYGYGTLIRAAEKYLKSED